MTQCLSYTKNSDSIDSSAILHTEFLKYRPDTLFLQALVIFGGVNSDEDLHDVAVWRPHSSQASSTLIRTESEILIQKPEGLPMTLAETIDPSVFTGSSGGQVLPLEPPTATSHPSTAQIIPPAPQLGDLLSSPPALDPSQQIKLAAGARTSEDMSDATAALS